MAEKKTDEQELDEDGKPIPKPVESGEKPLKIKSKTDEGDADLEPEAVVPVRRSAAQNIIARQQRTIKKLRSKDEEDKDLNPPKDEDDVDDDEEDDALTPEARGVVQREVARAIDPVVKSLASQADEDELKDLLAQEPESAKFEKRIRAYMGNPHYKGVPPSVIYHHLAFDVAAATGVRRKGAADLDAGQRRGGGRTTRPTDAGAGAIPSVEEQGEMTDAEFEALQNRARSGEFVKPGE